MSKNVGCTTSNEICKINMRLFIKYTCIIGIALQNWLWEDLAGLNLVLFIWFFSPTVCIMNTCEVKISQSCLTLCDPMDCSQPGSSVHGILQAIILEWVATPSSRASSQSTDGNPGLLHCRQSLYHLSHQGNPIYTLLSI